MSRLGKAAILLFVAFLAAAGSVRASGRPSFRVQPAPSWVVPPPPHAASPVPESDTSGLLYTLEDHQLRVNELSTERYFHESYKVTSQAGLDAGSQLKPEFDPTFQELIFHSISIRRGEKIIDALRPREIKLIQPEADLDEREYNGRISALIFLNDVRVGDIVDYEYSVNGSNPVMRGRFAGRIFLVGNHLTQCLRRRLVWASGRALRFKAFNTELEPVIRDIGSVREYTWQRENVLPVQVDDGTPEWFDPYPFVQLADFSGWDDVAAWAVPLYKTSLPISSPLINQILAWKTASAQPEDRLVAALRFVQDDVRYLAIEIGPNSNRPNLPSVVFQRRYGDCKDKSFLLVTILNELGIEAYPALVNTQARDRVNRFQPSPFSFDHCIVKAICAGKSLWLDPTISLQRGALDNLSGADEGLALVLRDGSSTLEVIPSAPNDSVSISVNEVYTVTDYSAPASLEVKTTFRNGAADSQRYSLSRQPLSEVARKYLNYYADTDPAISAEEPPGVVDDPISNTLVITERYRIPDFWRGATRDVFADRINDELGRPSISQRGMPLAISYPVFVEQNIEMHLPDRPEISSATGTLSDEATHFEYNVRVSGKIVHLDYLFRTLQDHVEAGRVANHLELIERIRTALGRRVSHKNSSSQPEEMSDTAAAIVVVLLAAPFIVIALIVGARRGKRIWRLRSFSRGLQVGEGDGPEKPILIPSRQGLQEFLRSLKCRCGAPYNIDETTPSEQGLIYDGRRMITVTLACGKCSATRDTYFAPADVS